MAVEERAPLGTIEKDYAITCALFILSKSNMKDRFVFKGGTAIKKIYFPEARFSEDLDFTVIGINIDEILEVIQNLYNDTGINSISFREAYEENASNFSKSIRVPFIGPLNHKNSIRFDLSFRNDLLLDLSSNYVNSIYETLTPFEIFSLQLIELFSEKIRAIISRESPRDYFDVWAHIDRIQNKDFLKHLSKTKCEVIGIEFNPSNIFDEDKLARIESSWKMRLQHLLSDYIEFKETLSDLQEKLSFLLS